MSGTYHLALPMGTVLAERYILERVLGQGGFGITYMSYDQVKESKVAIKEYFPDYLATRTGTTVTSFAGERAEHFAYGLTCFLQEADTLAKLTNIKGVVNVLDYFEENGTAYFVMEYIEGISFDSLLTAHGGKIEYEKALEVLLPVMEALEAVHAKGIIHRDVTPDNIYITHSGEVKLLDFGAARYSLGDKSRSLDVLLKHGYAPKEQYSRRGRQGPYTDVYTLGVCFYVALTGQKPSDSIDRMDEDDLVPPRQLGVNITEAQERALLMAMEVRPENRFQTMTSFKNALLQISGKRASAGNRPVPYERTPVSVNEDKTVCVAKRQPVDKTVPWSEVNFITQQEVIYEEIEELTQEDVAYEEIQPKKKERTKENKIGWVVFSFIVFIWNVIMGMSIFSCVHGGSTEPEPLRIEQADE